MGRGWKSLAVHARNVDGKVHFGEALEENGEHVVGHWRKGDPYCKMAKNLAEPCPSAFARQNLGAMKLDIQQRFLRSIWRAACFLLTAYDKMWKERDEPKKELLNQKKPDLKDLENSQPIHIPKN